MANNDERFPRGDLDVIEFISKDGKTKTKFEFNDEFMEFLDEDERKMLELTVAGFSHQLAGVIENKRNFEKGGLSLKEGLAVVLTKLQEANQVFLRGKNKN